MWAFVTSSLSCTVRSIFRTPLGLRSTNTFHTLEQTCHLLGSFIAFLQSSVGCINNSSVFCILSALYIFILCVCLHVVWSKKFAPVCVLQKGHQVPFYQQMLLFDSLLCWDPLVWFVSCSFNSEDQSVVHVTNIHAPGAQPLTLVQGGGRGERSPQ